MRTSNMNYVPVIIIVISQSYVILLHFGANPTICGMFWNSYTVIYMHYLCIFNAGILCYFISLIIQIVLIYWNDYSSVWSLLIASIYFRYHTASELCKKCVKKCRNRSNVTFQVRKRFDFMVVLLNAYCNNAKATEFLPPLLHSSIYCLTLNVFFAPPAHQHNNKECKSKQNQANGVTRHYGNVTGLRCAACQTVVVNIHQVVIA